VTSEQQAEIIQKCINQTDEEMSLIADLLELCCLQMTTTPARKDFVMLESTLQEVVEQYRAQAETKGLKMNLAIEKNIPPVYGNNDHYRCLWANLLSNAIKYTPGGGEVTISLRTAGGNVMGDVSDTGIGIPQGEQKRLFTEFFRAGNAKELNVPGTGLGLVIVKKIIEEAGGKIMIKSETGCGAKFTFTLPAEAHPATKKG